MPAEQLPSQPPAPKEGDNRKCDINLILGTTLVEWLKCQPEHPTARALVLAKIKQGIPNVLVSFDDIKEWIETTIDPAKLPEAVRRANSIAFRIPIEHWETEVGRAYYRNPLHGTGNFDMPVEALVEIAREHEEESHGLESVLDSVIDYIVERAGESIQLDSVGDFEHHSHESNGAEDPETNVNRERVNDLIRDFLSARYPELYESLEQNT